MCRYQFKAAFLFELVNDKRHKHRQQEYIESQLKLLGLKDFSMRNILKLLENKFEEGRKIFKNED